MLDVDVKVTDREDVFSKSDPWTITHELLLLELVVLVLELVFVFTYEAVEEDGLEGEPEEEEGTVHPLTIEADEDLFEKWIPSSEMAIVNDWDDADGGRAHVH